MNRAFLILAIFVFLLINCFGQTFNYAFSEGSLRINFIMLQGVSTDSVVISSICHDKYFSGKNELPDKLENFGCYRIVVNDSLTNQLIYTKGFCTLFEEYKTTKLAAVDNFPFEESVSIPFPKQTVAFSIQGLDSLGHFKDLKFGFISPKNVENTIYDNSIRVNKIISTGDYKTSFDLVFMAEGYRKTDYKKFTNEVNKLVNRLFEFEPYKHLKSKINIWTIFSPSIDKGIDEPHWNKWCDTKLNFSFGFFGIDRYIGTYSYWDFCELGSYAPGDAYVAVVNSDKYGGGGIYNHYSVVIANHEVSDYVLAHELGHSIAGLADEYYDSVVAYNNFFSNKFEPWHPNITNLVNFNVKWGDLIDKDVPIPTPDNFKFLNKVGVFEGAGYSAKGIYRPYHNCIMKSHSADKFCPVCAKVISDRILKFAE